MYDDADVLPKRSLLHKAVNVFISVLAGLFFLLMAVVAFMQTATFRELLRSRVISIVNDEIHGEINIGKIDGSFFTGLTLTDVSLKDSRDTVASVHKVELLFNPLYLIKKNIYVRYAGITGLNARLYKDSAGALNITKIFPSRPDEDTTTSPFPFTITAAAIEMKEINFLMQDEKLRGSNEQYPALNLSDIRINHLELFANATADINAHTYELEIEKSSLQGNFISFGLKKMSGLISLSPRSVDINDFELETEQSGARLNASLSGIDFLGDFTTEQFADAPLSLRLEIYPFDFDDLSTFVPATSFLKGKLTGELQAVGNLNDLSIPLLQLEYADTKLKLEGKLTKILEPRSMGITAVISNSKFYQPDVKKLMPELSYAGLDGYNNVTIDTLTYTGGILKFNSRMAIATESGRARGSVLLDFTGDEMVYKGEVQTYNLSLQPFTDYPFSLNTSVAFSGAGTNVNTLETDVSGHFDNTISGTALFTDGELQLKMTDGYAHLETKAATANAGSFKMKGDINFTDIDKPAYTADIVVNALDAGKFIADSTLPTSLSFEFKGRGAGFKPDDLNGEFLFSSGESSFKNNNIDPLSASLLFDRSGKERIITVESNLLDLNIHGDFTIARLDSVIRNERAIFNNAVISTLGRYFPSLKSEVTDEQRVETKEPVKPAVKSIRKTERFITAYEKPLSFISEVRLKDLGAIKKLIGNRDISADGSLKAELLADSARFQCSITSSFEFAKYKVDDDASFASDARFAVSLFHTRAGTGFSDIGATFDFTSPQVFFAGNYKNLSARASLREGQLRVSASGEFEEMKGELVFDGLFKDSFIDANFTKLFYRFKQYDMVNERPFSISVVGDNLAVNDFNLVHGNSKLLMNGTAVLGGKQDININLLNFKGYDLSYYFMGSKPENIIDNDINLFGEIKGTQKNPEITIAGYTSPVNYKGVQFGQLQCFLRYSLRNLFTDLRFLEPGKKFEESNFYITGNIPIDLSFSSVKERLINNKQVNLIVKADKFNLESFRDVLPFIKNVRGTLNADLSFTGTYQKLNRKGYMSVVGGQFLAEKNNLPYATEFRVSLRDEGIYLDTLILANAGRVKTGGVMFGKGEILFKGLDMKSLRVVAHGDLAVLGDDSKKSLPALYGPLLVGSDGDIVFEYKQGLASLNAKLEVKEADLVFPPMEGGYGGPADNFVYKYIEKKQQLTDRELEIQRLLNSSAKRLDSLLTEQAQNFAFDYSVQITLKKEANVTFIFAQEANLRLTAQLKGSILNERKTGISNIQGELQLLEGSTLTFIKSFSALGSLRFESDITNPYLDITGLYKDLYIPNDSAAVREDEVAVKVKLKGPLRDLGKNFSQSENNIAVYYGTTNIANETPSAEYDKADAIWFIITGKFKKELTEQDKRKASTGLAGQATALAASMLGGLLNTYLGDYVRSLEFRNVGTSTKFNLSGRFKDLRYTIGGSTNFLQDFSTANVRIEYPLLDNFLIRLERREATIDENYSNEMINELGLKYRFEF